MGSSCECVSFLGRKRLPCEAHNTSMCECRQAIPSCPITERVDASFEKLSVFSCQFESAVRAAGMTEAPKQQTMARVEPLTVERLPAAFKIHKSLTGTKKCCCCVPLDDSDLSHYQQRFAATLPRA